MENNNPYAPPLEPSVTSPLLGQVLAPEPTSQGKRFLNYIIDTVVTVFLSNACGFVVGVIYALSRPDPTALLPSGDEAKLNVIGSVLGLVIMLAYFLTCEALFGRTLGKLLTGTRVVAADGAVPTTGQIIGRTFARIIPFEAFSFLGSSNPIGWHDSLSKTLVINAR